MPKKLKGGTLWDFPTSILSQNIKKMQGDPLREKNFEKKSEKKCLAVPKKIERGDSLVQFDTIIFCRTFKNYFGQFVWIEKKESL